MARVKKCTVNRGQGDAFVERQNKPIIWLLHTSSDKTIVGVHNSQHIDSSLRKRFKKSDNCNHGAALYLYISKTSAAISSNGEVIR